MSTRSKLTACALISLVAATAMATTSANASHLRPQSCTWLSYEGCKNYPEQPQIARRAVTRLDASPSYVQQTDPRYNSAMSDAGGGGGDGGDGGGGGGGR